MGAFTNRAVRTSIDHAGLCPAPETFIRVCSTEAADLQPRPATRIGDVTSQCFSEWNARTRCGKLTARQSHFGSGEKSRPLAPQSAPKHVVKWLLVQRRRHRRRPHRNTAGRRREYLTYSLSRRRTVYSSQPRNISGRHCHSISANCGNGEKGSHL